MSSFSKNIFASIHRITFRRFLPVKSGSIRSYATFSVEDMVKGKLVYVFMKGTPEKPLCGFSNAVVQILNVHGVNNFDSYDVLENEEVRKGVKDYTKWPTIPQIFLNGEFIGGCDIIMDLHKSGELIEQLKKVGIRSLLDKQKVPE